ncbi:hypothetical protein F5Y14DRAFT_152692 [Nemania sp. NC0429]|nr:hypothetical protein F5Y14DRAFT_152692 [Nemania sp. NC0429]
MTSRWSLIWALLVFLHLYGVVAGPLPALRRDDTTPTIAVVPTSTSNGNEGAHKESSSQRADETKPTRTPPADTTPTVTTTSTTVFPSAINGNDPDNTTPLATPSPIPEGQLPIQPRLTPGWGIAGAILLISGVTYTLVGIKNAWLYTFFSAAFLSGLSVTVLVVYVMIPPVPVAIEGAYVVAAVVTGLILGGAATVFQEITEGLGCLLGGFSVAMWLLTLKPGGLLPSTPAKAIFIAAFSAGSYGFYFSRHTRPYALMGLMAFAGATVTVIGIDCFSRAGLKEFWAYIWNLNKGLFPYAADTYPLTKGIRVEIALTVVLTIIGIISQLKLWKVIQERRAKKAEVQAEEQSKRDEEEASLGLQVEAQNARERQQWETVYGNQPPRSSAASGDSGIEDADDDEKKDHTSRTITRQVSSNEESLEMVDLPTPNPTNSPAVTRQPIDRLMTTREDHDNGVTIGVARDDESTGKVDAQPTSDTNEEKAWTVNGDGVARPTSHPSSRTSQILTKPPGPEITPLPFNIPIEMERNESRSSIATYADEDDENYVFSNPPSRMSMINRLSVSSGNLMRNFSQRSIRSPTWQENSGGLVAAQSPEWTESTEVLVENPKHHSDALSIAATIDGLSQDGDTYDYTTKNQANRMSIPAVTVDLGGESAETSPDAEKEGDGEMKLKPPSPAWRVDARPTSSAETIGTDILNSSVLNSSSADLSKRSSLNQTVSKTEDTNNTNPTDMNAIEETSESSRPPKSLAPSISSTSMSLTKERLPSALPRVALSYRTNEWAKHLSAAETPPLEQLQLDEHQDQQSDGIQETEAAAPVHVDELQQSCENGVPPVPIMPPSPTSSNLLQVTSPTHAHRSTPRTASYYSPLKAHIPATLAILTSASSDTAAQASPVKPSSPNVTQAGHSSKNRGRRASAEVYNQPIQEETSSRALHTDQPPSPDVDGTPTPNSNPPSPTGLAPVPGLVSYSSPQTLLGRREMFLRNKSQSQLLTTAPIQEDPEGVSRPASQMALAHNYTVTSLLAHDADDIPLSQRKQLMRQSSMPSAVSVNAITPRSQRRSSSNTAVQPQFTIPTSPPPHMHTITADSSHFDSHQPERRASRPSQAARDARLSQFRQSVAADLRAATPNTQKAGLKAATARETVPTNAEIGRAIDMQRNALLSQREKEAQRREAERWDKERVDRAFEEMMRRGDLVDAHREALRRMQSGVKHA